MMKNLYDSIDYIADVKLVATMELPWDQLNNKILMLTGATGQIGSFLIDVLLYRNVHFGMNCTIYAIGRNREKARNRFGVHFEDFRFFEHDINKPLTRTDIGHVDYVLHLASNTHPIAYASDPIGTITTNIIGTANLLDFAVEHGTKRCAFASSNEVYGENRGDVEKFDETYCGYIDCNTMRAGYPESKRCGEALCQAYIKQKGMDIVIPRLTRTYGPTLLSTDTKALSQFIHKAISNEDIVLKSAGTQYYSYTYVADAVSGLLTILLLGEKGEAYNIADDASDIQLKDLAAIIAGSVGKNVVFEIPDDTEKAGYSKATKARLDSQKLQELGWKASFSIQKGVDRTIKVLTEIK
jgi:nucleoside-diphosphate-sugar epimerase